ncbi:putative serine/threonine-protein kinase [Fusarium oxysporum f. sp. raphani]|nr:putative serine/threonine-protein kinase [Fusarium oxysporum f. sp. raphani]
MALPRSTDPKCAKITYLIRSTAAVVEFRTLSISSLKTINNVHTSRNAIGMDYQPQEVVAIIHHSTNAIIGRLGDNIVLKYPRYAWWDFPDAEQKHRAVRDAKASFLIEGEVLKLLGDHPRIVKFLGRSDPEGFKFAEADKGNLQQYIDSSFHTMTLEIQAAWCLQAAEAIAYLHSKDVIHSDLRPENFLLYSCPDGRIEIRLCDFGGSTYGERTGLNLPDSGFFDTRKPPIPKPATDIFSLGSVFYTIMSGHWPHWADGEDLLAYRLRVDELFEKGEFPTVSNLFGDSVIQGCWNDQYVNANELLVDCRQVFNGDRGI